MRLDNLVLTNFRNYKNINIDLNKNLNVFIGNNGEGKTNILEGIYVSSLLKSHRINKITNLIKFSEKSFDISIKAFSDNNRKIKTSINVNEFGKKKININGMNITKLCDFIGKIKVVMFSPEDIKIVKESPMIRRKFLDINISQIDSFYLNSIMNYNKVLTLKNNLLKQTFIDDKLLDVYDEQLSYYINDIINKRILYINLLNDASYNIHNEISNKNEKLYIKYKTFLNLPFNNIEDNFDIKNYIFDILRKNRSIDKIKKYSSQGIHKDDFIIFINDRDVLNYSSQGQQRSSIISIKLAIVKIIKDITNEYPILLLDDILSELDKYRRNFILNFIPNIQTFITSTELYENISRESNVFNIKHGEIL